MASDARALSENIDALFHNQISNFTKSVVTIDVTGFSEHPDFLALLIIVANAGRALSTAQRRGQITLSVSV